MTHKNRIVLLTFIGVFYIYKNYIPIEKTTEKIYKLDELKPIQKIANGGGIVKKKLDIMIEPELDPGVILKLESKPEKGNDLELNSGLFSLRRMIHFIF
jgi:hypothetical protein